MSRRYVALALTAVVLAACGSATPPVVEVRTDSYVERMCACKDNRCIAEVERNSTEAEHRLGGGQVGEFDRLLGCMDRIMATMRAKTESRRAPLPQ